MRESIVASIGTILATAPGSLPHDSRYGCEIANLRHRPARKEDHGLFAKWIESAVPACDPRVGRLRVLETDMRFLGRQIGGGAYVFVRLKIEVSPSLGLPEGAGSFEASFECRVCG